MAKSVWQNNMCIKIMRLCYAVKQKKINQNSMLSIIIVAIIYHAVICIENCQCIEYDD
ncbi:MAG: hypothetical protein HFE57_11595 [Firmicutes bacterium]|nr:hypothetical protein [Bacillota bacterium]